MPEQSQTRHIFFDMDGVLAKHVEEDYGDSQNYLQPHYYQHREPDERACKLFTALAYDANPDNLQLHILTKLNPDCAISLDWYYDKQKWLTQQLAPFQLPMSNLIPKGCVSFHITLDSKVNKARGILGRNLNGHDILIDDFGDNLKEWAAAGGTAIKYANPNSQGRTWNGPRIPTTMPATDIQQFLYAYLDIQPWKEIHDFN